MKRYWSEIILGLILLIGSLLRVYNVSTNPPGFFADEAAIGYNAYTILHNGVDEYGKVFPIFFQSFGDYKTPVEIYSTVISVFFFGLNAFSVRIVSAIYGLLAVFVLYFLTLEVFHHEKMRKWIALSATFLLAISPWEIHMSRIAMEGITPFIFFVVLGTYLFLKCRTHPNLFPLSILAFSIGMYTYFPSRLFIPLFSVLLFAFFQQYIPRRRDLLVISMLIIVIFALPFVASIKDGTFEARISQVSIFTAPPKNETAFSHIAINYMRHFSLDFLFTKGDIGMPGQFITRQSIRGMGELYLFELPLLVAGLIYFLHKRRKLGLFFLCWVLLYPVGSMFTTNESPYATRSIIGVIPFSVISGLGLWYLLSVIRQFSKHVYHVTACVFAVIIAVSLLWYIHLYFQDYPLYSADFWGWQYGPEQIVNYFVAHKNQYDDFGLAGDFNAPDIFLKFYAPNGECSQCKIALPRNIYNPNRRQLFAMTTEDITHNPGYIYHTVSEIFYPNGTTAFWLVTVSK